MPCGPGASRRPSNWRPVPQPNQPPQADPFAAVAFPSSGCSAPASDNQGTGTRTLDPGTFSSLTVSSGNTLTLNPGQYWLTGDLSNGGGRITGEGVTLYFCGSAKLNLSSNNNGVTNLSGPAAGVSPGFVLFFDPANTGDALNFQNNNAGVHLNLTGIVYAPNARMYSTGGSSASVFNITGDVVVGRIYWSGAHVLNVREGVPPPDTGEIELIKGADPATYGARGETITYSYVVTNSGSVLLTDIVLTDSRFGTITCPEASLAPGASMVCEWTHITTRADVEAGHIDNTATVRGKEPDGTPVEDSSFAEVTYEPAPAISVVKTAAPATYGEVGQQIAYTYVVTNSGNTPLRRIRLSDDRLGTITCPRTRLLPGRSMTCTATHETTAADLRAGDITNVAAVRGTAPDGTVVGNDDDATVMFVPAPGISVVKTASATTYGGPGERIIYTYVVTNSGNVPLRGIVLDDSRLGPIMCPATRLLPGRSMTCTAAHVTTVRDVRRGHITNAATVHGTAPDGTVETGRDEARVRFVPRPGISVAKSASPATYGVVGESITYTYVVTNSGNVPLSGIALTDSNLGTISCPATRLLPGRTMTCTATHVTTVADLQAGHITNIATVQGTAPDGTVETGRDEATVTFVPRPGISVAKSASPTTYGAPGETITYTYVVTNSGNVPLSRIALTDSNLGTITCPATSLLPGRSMTCMATYVTTVADMRAEHITNAATVTGRPPRGRPVSGSDEAEVVAVRTPAISLTQSAAPATYGVAGETITYTYVVTNSGNVTLSGIVLTDSNLGTISCPATRLLPGRTMTCTATHVTTAADLQAGHITNTATVDGTAPDGTVVSDSDEATVTAVHTPAISVTKTAAPATYRAAGETITYTYVATNSGNAPLSGIALTDSKLGTISCPATALPPGQSMTCTATYVTTAADVRAGHITNAVTATGTAPDGTVVSDSTEASVAVEHPAGEAGAMRLVKTASVASFTRAGQRITYHYRLTNTGNAPLTGITVTDDRAGTATCPQTSLAIGAHMTCTATYTTTSADVTAGRITNVGTATGRTPAGTTVRTKSTMTLRFTGTPPSPPSFTG